MLCELHYYHKQLCKLFFSVFDKMSKVHTEQSRVVTVPTVQLTMHVKSSTLYGRLYDCTSKFFWLDGLLLFCIIMGLCSASSTITINNSANFFSLSLIKCLRSMFLFICSAIDQRVRKRGENVSDTLIGAPSILLFGPYHLFTLPVQTQSNIESIHEGYTNNLDYEMKMMFLVNTTTCACIFSPVIRSSC